jgi:hypothetical protein
MGIMVRQNEDINPTLNDRIRADLRRKAEENSKNEDIDFSKSSEYTKNSKKTSRFGWIWFVLILLAAVSVLLILLS